MGESSEKCRRGKRRILSGKKEVKSSVREIMMCGSVEWPDGVGSATGGSG